jgi:Phage portal protein
VISPQTQVSTVSDTKQKHFSNYRTPPKDMRLGDEFKSMDYQVHEQQFQNPSTFASAFSLTDKGIKWTNPDSYKARTDRLYFECVPSRAFIDKRADSIATIQVDVPSGSSATKALLVSPNTIDNTLGQFLRVSETELALGGDVFWFLDERVPGLPQLRVLRQDFVIQYPKDGIVDYVPGKANGQNLVELRFQMKNGRCVGVQHSATGSLKDLKSIKGDLFHVMRFNPLSSGQGSGDGDAVLKAADTWVHLYEMVNKRAQAGGRKQGIIKAPHLETAEELAAWEANMAALNSSGVVNVLADGADYVANQLSFTDMDLIKLMERCTRDIALAYGVPAVFANLEGESSYAERRAADRIFYKGWVHPRATWLIGQLEAHLRRRFDPTCRLEIDKTQIDYIKEELGEEQERMSKSGIFTIDECRAVTGVAAMPNGQGLAIPGKAAATPPDAPAASAESNAVEQALSSALGKPREVDFNADTSRRPDQR